MSDLNPRSTRSRRRRLDRQRSKRTASSTSTLDSDVRKTKSEPILITLDSDSGDDVESTVSSRPNRTARIRGELIRKLGVQMRSCTHVTSYKDSDSSSSTEYEKVKKKKKPKPKPSQIPSGSCKRKQYLVKKLSQTQIPVRHHTKPKRRPLKKVRKLQIRSLRKRFEFQNKKKPERLNPLNKRNSVSSQSGEKRRGSSRNDAPSETSRLSTLRSEKVSKKSKKNNSDLQKSIMDDINLIKNSSIPLTADENLDLDNERLRSVQSNVDDENQDRVLVEVKTENEDGQKGKKLPSRKAKGDNFVSKTEETDNLTLKNVNVEPKTENHEDHASESRNEDDQISRDENLECSNPKSEEANSPTDNLDSTVSKDEEIADSSLKNNKKILKLKIDKKESTGGKLIKKETANLKASKAEEDSSKSTSEMSHSDNDSAAEKEKSREKPRKTKSKFARKAHAAEKVVRKRGRPRLCENKPVPSKMPLVFDRRQVPFLQNSFCFDVAPKLPKCRECRIAFHRKNCRMFNAYCRFMQYRKLCYNRQGTILNAGFSEPSDATSEHLSQWLPETSNPPKDLNIETAKALLEHIGDQFCDLIEQEKEALSLHIGKDKTITWKRIVQGVREMCDVCYTTIFNIHWVCPICGLAVCIDCYKMRKQGIRSIEDEEDRPRNRDEYKWLLCTQKELHVQENMVMAQIIPGQALWIMRDLLHKARDQWNVPAYCKCVPQEADSAGKSITTGICKQLMSFVTKSFSTEKKQPSIYNEIDQNHTELNYEDLDIEVTGSALKWLEETNDASDDNKEKEDFYSYEDFALLRGNLLQDLPDEETFSDTEGICSGFSFDEIIASVSKAYGDPKESSEKALLKHFSRRYPKASSGRDPLPIRIYTKLESNLVFESIPHSWFCNGRLLFLHKANHPSNLSLFQEQWKRGQPILVRGVEEQLDKNLWHPDAFCRDFGEVRNDLVDCMTGAVIKNLPMKRFWEGFQNFNKRLKDDNGEYMLLKLKDWPPGEDFSEKLPSRFKDLMQALPLPEYTHRDGVLNLAGRLPSWFVRPDLGPKMYNAYGSALFPTKGTTNLHLDVSDAVNVMVYVGIPSGGNAHLHIQEALKAIDEGGCDSLMRARVRHPTVVPGALWHIYNARDADKIRDMLTKVAIERGEKLEANNDPIHDQSWYIDAELRKRLYRDYGVEGYAIAQCLGDAVFIPAGAPHQVRNLHSCVKVAEDFVSPENIAHCFKLTQEFRHLSDTHTNHEDKLQIKNIIYHVVRDSLAHLLPDNLS
ncbi:lysine-specific demethylase 3B-like [Uloborus diversus]|uniref:lysine-specific demethylase 3B-like n=1 Tax=Uloborus diversus TaxID=327109 RepID=UPI002408FF36|nr:lysine-specific demethylase 3B-like [Uloborus diversus]